jgi:hypothetical protein
MQQKEIKDMLRHVQEHPQSEFSKFIFDPRNNAGDLIDFMMWVEDKTILVSSDGGFERHMKTAYNYILNPETYDTLIKKYKEDVT